MKIVKRYESVRVQCFGYELSNIDKQFPFKDGWDMTYHSPQARPKKGFVRVYRREVEEFNSKGQLNGL